MPLTSGKGIKSGDCKLSRLQEITKSVNEAYGTHIAASKIINTEVVILIGESTIKKTPSIIEAIGYLEGVKRGIELMNGEI